MQNAVAAGGLAKTAAEQVHTLLSNQGMRDFRGLFQPRWIAGQILAVMLLEVPWDRANPRSKPSPWRRGDVERALATLAATSEFRWVESSHDGVNHRYVDVTFECGCTAIEDRGWAPCRWSFHRLLADSKADSDLARRYFRLRASFDAALSASWHRRPMRLDEELAMHGRGTSPPQYRLRYDVTHRDVWYSEGLRPDLDLTPMNFELMLYNQANVRHPRLALELHHDDLSMAETAEAVDPLAITRCLGRHGGRDSGFAAIAGTD